MKIKIKSFEKFFEFLILYCCLFPYVSFGLNNLDSQPWVLILLIIYTIFKQKIEKQNLFLLWVICILTIIISMF